MNTFSLKPKLHAYFSPGTISLTIIFLYIKLPQKKKNQSLPFLSKMMDKLEDKLLRVTTIYIDISFGLWFLLFCSVS